MSYNPAKCDYDPMQKKCVKFDQSIMCRQRGVLPNGTPKCITYYPPPDLYPVEVQAPTACRNAYNCGAYAYRLRDVDPWSPEATAGIDETLGLNPICRIQSGPEKGQLVHCKYQLDTFQGDVACANLDTGSGNDGECVYCPPSADGSPSECAAMLPDDPDAGGGDGGDGALSAFRMRTRMSMARFH